MPRAAAPRGKRKAVASVDQPSSSSSCASDTLQPPKRPHTASRKRVYASSPRVISPLLSPKLPVTLPGKDDEQPPLELPSELDSELLPSGLSTSPERFLSPNKAYSSAASSSHRSSRSTLSLVPASPFGPSPSSPALLGLTRTPTKRRFSPSSDAAFWDLSPLSSSRSHYPPRHSTPGSPLDSPASTRLFRSPHAVTPRTGRVAITTFSSPSPSRARSLAPSLNVVAAENSLQLPPVMPSPLGERGASGESMLQLPTPRTLFLSYPWNTSSRNSSSGGETLLTPDKSQPIARSGDSSSDLSPPPHLPAVVHDDHPSTAVEYGEDSVDSLASVFSRTARPNPLVPLFFSPSRSVSHRSSSLISSRTQLRTPSSAHSRSSTSSSSSKKTSFSILASSSPAELSCVALQAVPGDSVAGSGKARQRLSFAAEEPQQQQPLLDSAMSVPAVADDEPAVKVEPGVTMEDNTAGSHSSLSTPVRSRMTEFVMAEDGLRATPAGEGEAEQPLLFAYRASADGHAPSELFPVSPAGSGLPSFRPRSYTFATRKDGKVNVSTTPPFSRLDRMLISPSSAALFTPQSPSPSTRSSHGPTSGSGARLPIRLSSLNNAQLSLSQLEYEERVSSAALSASLQSSSDVISVDGQPVKAKSCNCKKSQCLKLYCECFAHGRVCVDCNCTGCHNTDKPEHQQARDKAIAATRERDSNAFYRAAPLQAKAEKMKARAAGKSAAATTASSVLHTDSKIKVEAAIEPPTRSISATATPTPVSNGDGAPSEVVAAEVEPAIPPATLPEALHAAATTSASSAATVSPPPADSTTTSAADPPPPPAPTTAPSSLPARKGCNCKKSKCLKKYCECFQLGLKCTPKCKCVACLNGNSHHHQQQSADTSEQAGDKGKENVDQAADGKEAEGTGSGKEDRVRGAFLQVKVESHLACSSVESAGSQALVGDSAAVTTTTATTAATASSRHTPTPSKLSAWRLFPGGRAGSGASVPPLSNAPPIPVQPLAPFTLPAPFEIFHQLKREVAPESDAAMLS